MHNEFAIYDMPGLNQELAYYLKVNFPDRFSGAGSGNSAYFSKDSINASTSAKWGKNYIQLTKGDTAEKNFELWLSDVYYVTQDPAKPTDSRMAGVTEKKLVFPRQNPNDDSGKITAAEPAIVPKDIILEKPAWEPLTAAEAEKIQAAGGRENKVGKGFKLRIKNFASSHFAQGGYINLAFDTRVVNDSKALSDKGNPLYFNAASYYAQEIPTCKTGQENCVPIKVEKATEQQVLNRKKNEMKLVGITADVVSYQLLDVVKHDAAGKPLADANFTIYTTNQAGEKDKVAVSQAGEELADLVTDQNGKLTKNGKVIELKVLRGNYLIVETAAPAGYQITNPAGMLVAVQFAKKQHVIVNHKVPVDPPAPPAPAQPVPEPSPQPQPQPEPEPEPVPTPMP